MKSEFALAFNEVLEEKQLPRDVIMSALEGAMISAYRKSVGASTAQDVTVKIDLDKGNVTVFAEKEVVDSVLDERTEVTLEEARKVDPDCQEGDLVMVESTPENFGRIAAQTARQAIQQKIRDAEKALQFENFGKQVGEIVSGVVQAVNSYQATVGMDYKAEGTMMRKDMIPGERFRIHDRIRAYVYEVKDSPKGLQILLSRGHRNFLRRLLENEVPEIYHGIVEIRSIAREPGQRAKVAVSATQMGIDPVGACVGQRGVRIQAIVRELHNEKIDVIEWSPDASVYISKAISPARVSGVYLNSSGGENKTATVVVPEDQLSLAIGREGQNARLAAKLTGWRIDIMSVSEASYKALAKLNEDPKLAELAHTEAEAIARVKELLTKKEEGKPLSLDDGMLLAKFVDRVERRGEADRKLVEDANQAKLREIRASIPASAFEMNLNDVPEIKEHITNVLQESGIETLGELLMQIKVDPEIILSYNGIGPKSYEELLSLAESFRFPEPELPVEEPAQKEEVVSVAEKMEEAKVEPVAEAVAAEPAVQSVTEEAPEEEKTFEELFKLETLKHSQQREHETVEEEDFGQALSDKDGKKKSKKKKGYTVEYDPDLGEDIVRRTHKGENDWEDW
ncbi:MAG: transcription termination factor NusA [Anaerolineaceae bacterium]|nr:transcription termination factor NusA [Anaerolineaceae bacterium]